MHGLAPEVPSTMAEQLQQRREHNVASLCVHEKTAVCSRLEVQHKAALGRHNTLELHKHAWCAS